MSIGNNTTILQRSGTVTFVQYESGKPGYVSCQQAGGTKESRYSISIIPDGHVWKMTSNITFNFIVKCSLDIYINGVLISSVPAGWEVAGLSGYDPDHFTYNIVNGVLAVKPIAINTGGYRRAGITVRPVGDYSVRAGASLEHDNKL